LPPTVATKTTLFLPLFLPILHKNLFINLWSTTLVKVPKSKDWWFWSFWRSKRAQWN
jgi:hypothetical protein